MSHDRNESGAFRFYTYNYVLGVLQRDYKKIMTWGRVNKVAFAPEKTEMIHISRKRVKDNPPLDIRPNLV